MVITVNREHLLPALSMISGIVEKKQTLPILGNFLVQTIDEKMQLIATDLEIEIRTVSQTNSIDESEAFTLPAKKFVDICKSLPANAEIKLTVEDEKISIRSGPARFTIATLPAADYPSLEMIPAQGTFNIESGILKHLLINTAFSMAIQDGRHYLNGTLLDLDKNQLHCVATDGHRLAVCKHELVEELEEQQILLPRKSVFELIRLLDNSEDNITVEFGTGFCRFKIADTVLTTKLIDGKFPEYQRVIPKQLDKTAIINRENLRRALIRASLLSNEKHKGVKLNFSTSKLHLESSNNEQENAEDELEINYPFDEVSIGFNVIFLLDVIGTLNCEEVAIDLTDSINSIVIRNPEDENVLYVIMPMRL